MKICANEECGIEFEPATHNMIYHNSECCRIVTNKKLIRKYYEERARKQGLPRYCDVCETRLSRYNKGTVCGPCQTSSKQKQRQSLLELLGA